MQTLTKARPKLTIEEQICYMRDERGIKFNIVSESQAEKFLSENNYYFRLKAFEKNYSTYPLSASHDKAGKYCDLEFAYLQELSTLDMYLREQVLALSLDVEHYLRVHLMKDISNNSDEDGYSIVKGFLTWKPQVKDNILQKKRNSYCEDLINKYTDHYPVWVFIEVLSLGDLIDFCEYYYSKYQNPVISVGNIRIVKFLRNAAAHNNCLIHNLADHSGENFRQNREANSFVSSIESISNKVRDKKMGNRTVHDFVVLIYTFCKIVSSNGVKKHKLVELQNLLKQRFTLHSDYFADNALLVSNYDFIKKVVDKSVEMWVQ